MPKRLIAFGDSFVEGSISQGPYTNYTDQKKCNEISFVRHLEKYLNLDQTVNAGATGISNEMISYAAYEYMTNNPNPGYEEIILVAFSGLWRTSYYDIVKEKYLTCNKNKFSYKEPGFTVSGFITHLWLLAKNTNRKIYFTSSFVSYPIFIKSLDYKDLKKYNYIEPGYFRNTLFDIVALRFKSQKIKKDFISNEQLAVQHINHRQYNDEENMFDVKNSEFITPCHHPTPDGHKLIAKTLAQYIT